MTRLLNISVLGMVSIGVGAVLATAAGDARASSIGVQLDTDAAQRTVQQGTPAATVAEARASTATSGQTESGARTQANTDEQRLSGAGYSWIEKKSHPRREPKTVKLDPNRPLAQAPNFVVRADGSSTVSLRLSHPTEVKRVTRGRHVEYHLSHAQVGMSNNMNPLVTAHFASAVERVVLRRTKDGAALVIDLRENVEMTHQLQSSSPGGAMLEVTIARPVTEHSVEPSQPKDGAAPHASSQLKRRHVRRVPHPTRSPGPGPSL